MGSEYRLILMDEFDWRYVNFEKSKLINTRDSILSDDIFVECSIPYMVVISCGRTPAEKILAHLKNIGVPFDSAYSQLDNNPSLERITTAST